MITLNTATLPKFEGKPLIKTPESILQADFLGGEFGKAVLEEYRGRVKTDYRDNRNLNILSYNEQENVVQGSNSFAVVVVNQILRASGQPCLRTATQADLERILATNAFELRDRFNWRESALALRTADEPNSYLAKDLTRQVQARTGKEQKSPYMILLAGLDLKGDQDSPYGLAFKLRDDAELIEAPILNKGGAYFSSADIDKRIGLPTKLNIHGNRILFSSKDSGLSRLTTIGGYLGSDDGRLQYSNDSGRIVVVSDVAA